MGRGMRAHGWERPGDDFDFVLSPEEERVMGDVEKILEEAREAPPLDRHGPWRLLSDLVLGDLFHAMDVFLLRKVGVTHVLNLSPQSVKTGRAHYANLRVPVQYKEIWAEDRPEFDMLRVLEECHEFVDTGRQAGGVVLVHCHAGMNRSVAVVTSYIMVALRRSVDEVVRYVSSIRGHMLTNRSFVQQLVVFAGSKGLLTSQVLQEKSPNEKPSNPFGERASDDFDGGGDELDEENTIALSGLLADL